MSHQDGILEVFVPIHEDVDINARSLFDEVMSAAREAAAAQGVFVEPKTCRFREGTEVKINGQTYPEYTYACLKFHTA